ncbi:MAG: hypothetical protein D6689_09455 [Deltaproteobacteria bacterium]|nr:MAG: hypothetical protein D6689_09455 [Deltaproteobacteria bacterium]
MRAVCVLVLTFLCGCSLFMRDKRLVADPPPGEPPRCDTNAVVPVVDLIVGATGAAVGVGAAFGDGGSERATMAVAGVAGIGFLIAGWYGYRWHAECERARRRYEQQAAP